MTSPAWQFRLRPFPDELLSSWLARNACAHGLTPYRFYNLLLPGKPIWTRDIDRHAGKDLLEDLASLSGISRNRVNETTLQTFVSVLGGKSRQGISPLILAAGIRQFKRTRPGLQFCPQCLKKDAYFKRIWRLGFVFVCPIHVRNLLDACPICGAVIQLHRASHLDLIRCFSCGAKLSGNNALNDVPNTPMNFQTECLERLYRNDQVDRDWFRLVRSLLSVAATSKNQKELRSYFGLSSVKRFQDAEFEEASITDRIAMMETISRWTSDWPKSFRNCADSLGFTQRTFSRRTVTTRLAAEVCRLPVGQRRRRVWLARVFTKELLLEKRRHPLWYRQQRASKLLDTVTRVGI